VNPAGQTESVTVYDYPTGLTIPPSYSILETPNWNNQFYRTIECWRCPGCGAAARGEVSLGEDDCATHFCVRPS
jgi:hypothetical protein